MDSWQSERFLLLYRLNKIFLFVLSFYFLKFSKLSVKNTFHILFFWCFPLFYKVVIKL